MTQLRFDNEECVPCTSKHIRSMAEQNANELLKQVQDWKLLNEDGIMKLQRSWRVKSFTKGLEFFNLTFKLIFAWCSLDANWNFELMLISISLFVVGVIIDAYGVPPFKSWVCLVDLLACIYMNEIKLHDNYFCLSYMIFCFPSPGHHPDLHLFGWNNVKIEIWTHSVGGLTENDFILAAKINSLKLEHLLSKKPASHAV
ncbi:hypothetical protein IEQ34_002712 [Dendrobium chrysotoxum]|uniref:4a-hydroxytetrahydrobiopterin dehydratase n=1 Tax=Dendrobium chrysotoxum TaxID=161865 RepID=A0AAV7HHR5_DENCH|nr:hypothetical protein IEQ34_002712 [Dendrobium chrysotoxum]